MLAYVHRGDPLPTRRSGPTFEAAERKLLEAARAEADIQATLLWTGSSSVGRGLHELAERHRVDLVVLGSCGRAGLGRAGIGDRTRDALSGAPCAVAIAPAGYAQQPSMMRKIGVGYRGPPEGSHARAVARELATELGAKVSALRRSACRWTAPAPGRLTSLSRTHASGSPNSAKSNRTPLYGDPAEELTLYGTSVDLLIVGSRG